MVLILYSNYYNTIVNVRLLILKFLLIITVAICLLLS